MENENDNENGEWNERGDRQHHGRNLINDFQCLRCSEVEYKNNEMIDDVDFKTQPRIP